MILELMTLYNWDYSRELFGQQSPMHESKLAMQLGCMGSCEHLGRVHIHNPGKVHWQSAGNHVILGVLRPHNEISGLL